MRWAWTVVIAWLCVALLAKFVIAADAYEARRPNILLILVDDLGKEWVGAYGAEGIGTPNVDRLATSGLLFRNFYVMPQCTPTRVSLLTGQYPFRHGWVNHWDVPRWGGGCSFDPQLNPSLPRVLRSAGYSTVAAGKWQIDDFRQEPDAMQEAGFDEYLMWTGYEAGNPRSAERYWNPYLYSSTGSRTWGGRFGPDLFTDFLIEFMQRHREQPMFLYYPMVLTHPPLTPTPREPHVTEAIETHRAMVRYADLMTGRLMDALDRLNLRQSTLILWTTDNGTSRGIVGRVNGRDVSGGKAQTLETGVCVPLIASWPRVIPAGQETAALVDVTDLFPTLAEIANAPLPDDHVFDGISFSEVLRGDVPTSRRRWMMAMGGKNEAQLSDRGVENRYWFRDRVLRNERYKLYVDARRRPHQLVDLIQDPEETTNLLTSDDPETRAALTELMAAASGFPERDADPRYRPLPARPWYRQPTVRSQVWKEGYPNHGSDGRQSPSP